MEQKNSLSAMLRADTQTAQNISEMYPADWNMDAVYQKAYRKYRERAACTDASLPSTAQQRFPLRKKITLRANRWITAACLMLTVGIAGGVAWMQMSAGEPPRTPPNESLPIEEILPEQTTAVHTDADAVPETATAAHSTEAALPASETRAETQTALPSPSGTTAVQPATNDAPQTSADVPTAAETPTQQTASQQTTAKQTTAKQTTAKQTSTQQTSAQQTAPPQSTVQPTGTRLTTTRLTEEMSPATTARTTTRPFDTTPPQTTIPDTGYQPPSGNDTPPTGDESPTDSPPSGGAPSSDAPRLTVTDFGSEFSVAYDFEDQTVYPQPDFTVDLEGYTVTINRTDYSFSNLITNDETGASAWVSFYAGARWQSPFKYSVYSYQETTVRQNGEASPAVLITGDTNCFLIWFDGRYLCNLGIKTEYKDELFRIAEAMITH